MKYTLTVPMVAAMLSLITPAIADTRGEVESARANARAGGPVSEHDAELLKRWGCISGARSRVCKAYRYGSDDKRRRWR